MYPSNRRQFLCSVMGSGAALGVGAGLWRGRRTLDPTAGHVADASSGEQPVVRTARGFGTEVSITALHPNRETAERAIAAAFAELEHVEETMSLYRPHSQLCRLNRDGVLDNP